MIDLIWKNRQNDVIVFFSTIFVCFCPSRKFRVWILSLYTSDFPNALLDLPPPSSCALVAEQIFRLVSKSPAERSKEDEFIVISRCVAEKHGRRASEPDFREVAVGSFVQKVKSRGFSRDCGANRRNQFFQTIKQEDIHEISLLQEQEEGKHHASWLRIFLNFEHQRERKDVKVRLPLRLYGCSTVNAFLSLLVRRSKNFPFTVLWRNSYAFVVCLNRCSVKSYED